jgi:hypothetical protein
MTYELFTTPKFFNSLPSITRQNPNIMLKLLEHNSRFQDLLRNRESFLGEEVNIGLNYHQDGRERVFESGRRINIDAIKEQGIDPRFILVYRVTQPSYVSKPEYYWTTDFFEVIHGLRREISLEHRKKSVILFSTLDQINKNGGLIMDVNDDNGLAVRQISNKPFNQNLCLSRVPTY